MRIGYFSKKIETRKHDIARANCSQKKSDYTLLCIEDRLFSHAILYILTAFSVAINGMFIRNGPISSHKPLAISRCYINQQKSKSIVYNCYYMLESACQVYVVERALNTTDQSHVSSSIIHAPRNFVGSMREEE